MALFGLMLSPYCDLLETHVQESSVVLAEAPSGGLQAIAAPASAAALADHDDATSCCAVIAQRPTAVSADALVPAGESPQVAIAAFLVRRSAEMRVREWHTRRPGLLPIAALHARSAPLLS